MNRLLAEGIVKDAAKDDSPLGRASMMIWDAGLRLTKENEDLNARVAELELQKSEINKGIDEFKAMHNQTESKIKADAIEEAIKETRECMEEGLPKWFCRVEDLRKHADKLRDKS